MIKQIITRIDSVIQLLMKSNELHGAKKPEHDELPKSVVPSEPKLLSVDQVAAKYGFHPSTVRRWARMKILPSVPVGGRDFFEETAVLDFIMNNGFDKYPRRRRKRK